MTEPVDTLHFVVEYFDGQDENDVGYPYYVASCTAGSVSMTTDGRTFAELFANIREVLELVMEEEDPVGRLGLVANPRINIVIDLPEYGVIR